MSSFQFSLPDKFEAATLFEQIRTSSPVVAPRSVDKPLVLYGAGDMGRMAKAYFDRVSIDITAVVDAQAVERSRESFWQASGYEIVLPENVSEALKKNAMLAVCIATVPYEEVTVPLLRQGWSDVVPFYDVCEAYRDRHPLGNGWFAGELSADDCSEISQMMRLWHDDLSRAHYLQFMAWHTLREEWRFSDAPVTIHDRYFIPEVCACLNEYEVFADVGAHRGEVSRRFATLMDDSYRKIIMIEADTMNADCCAEIANDMNNAAVIGCAVAEDSGSSKFYSGLGYASQLSGIGPDVLQVKKIDQLGMKDVSYLKLHLEGGELSALKGAERMIQQHRPIIAATAYHNRLGLWELPKWFAEHLSNYRLLLRLHSWCGTGAVIYAIPDERKGMVQ